MAYTKNVFVELDEVPGDMRVTVSIDEAWNSIEDEDDDIFWHFSSESEYREAFSATDRGFRITREI